MANVVSQVVMLDTLIPHLQAWLQSKGLDIQKVPPMDDEGDLETWIVVIPDGSPLMERLSTDG